MTEKAERKTKTPEEVIAILMNTPLASLVQHLSLGEFFPVDEPLAKDETVIGEMTYLEKALHSSCLEQAKKIGALKTENNAIIENAFHGDRKLDIARLADIKKEVENIEPLLSMIKDLFWRKIRERMEADGKEYPNLGIRDGHKVVSCPDSDEKIEKLAEKFISQLFEALHD